MQKQRVKTSMSVPEMGKTGCIPQRQSRRSYPHFQKEL